MKDREVEHLLHEAFAPVDPPRALADRLEARFERMSRAAAEELAEWELKAMRDPRNWMRPAIAVVAGSTAAAALFVLHSRKRRRRR